MTPTNTQKPFAISKAALCQGLDKALSSYKIAALTKKHESGRTVYAYIKNSNEIEFTYKPTVLPPKKFFFPQEETLVEYTTDGKMAAKITAFPQVLFGIRPCDLNGIKIMDEAFAEGHGDPNYMAKREQTVLIGMECAELCDNHAFCHKVKAHNIAPGYFDIMFYPHGKDGFMFQVASKKGQEFADKYLAGAEQSDIKPIEDFMDKKQRMFNEPPFTKLEKFPDEFDKHKTHPVWDQEGARCLSCGSCIMVCPTCYCFDVTDETELNLKKGARSRKWDACMLSSFAVVAGGENFRHSATGRLHHRIDRKFNFLMKKHGQAVCVGCGRCVRACLADISPKTFAEAIDKA